jgi:hypothetical protein
MFYIKNLNIDKYSMIMSDEVFWAEFECERDLYHTRRAAYKDISWYGLEDCDVFNDEEEEEIIND